MPTRDRAPLGSPVLGRPVDLRRRGQPRVLQRALRLGGPGAEPRVRRLLHVHPRRGPRGRRHGRHGRHAGRRHLEDLPGHRRHRQDARGGRGRRAPRSSRPPWRWPTSASRPCSIDPTGADVGAWQPGTFPGFTVLDEHGAPSWFELHTRDYAAAVDFYRTVFRLGDERRSATPTSSATRRCANPDGEGELAGIMDAARVPPRGRARPLVGLLGGRRRLGRGRHGQGARRLGGDGRRGHPLRAPGHRDRPRRRAVQAADAPRVMEDRLVPNRPG